MTRANKARSTVKERSRVMAPVASSSDSGAGNGLVTIVVSWNKGAQDLRGYTAVEMIGQPIALLIPEHLHEESLQSPSDICARQPLRNETERKSEETIVVLVYLRFPR
jgi:PAS domain S-box-containing protein